MVSGIVPRSNKLNYLIENNEGNNKSPGVLISKLREKSGDNVNIAHLNFNFLQNKFEPRTTLMHGKVDILMTSLQPISS